jgi:hypothetical protein
MSILLLLVLMIACTFTGTLLALGFIALLDACLSRERRPAAPPTPFHPSCRSVMVLGNEYEDVAKKMRKALRARGLPVNAKKPQDHRVSAREAVKRLQKLAKVSTIGGSAKNPKRWAKDWDACLGHGGTDCKHHALGYCRSYYYRRTNR